MIWYAFYYLLSGNEVGPILTTPEHTRGQRAVTMLEIFIWGYSPGSLGDGIPSAVQGEAPVRSLGHKVPQYLKQFPDIVYRF